MAVHNVHERLVATTADAMGELLDTLSAGPEDRLWPSAHWPALRLDRGLSPGSAGGHGPIRYTVTAYEPGVRVRFVFTGPPGFHGFHEFTVVPVDARRTLLRHTLSMRTTGAARLTWPLLYRPLHDALVEDGLDRAEAPARPARWSPYVRLLRAALARYGRAGSDDRRPGRTASRERPPHREERRPRRPLRETGPRPRSVPPSSPPARRAGW